LVEHAADTTRSEQGCLIDWLLNDAAEACFDIATRPLATNVEARLRVAA
jgi:hypothetical protein